ncbi:MAG: methyl-accepting chemotaxis protein [Terracidiphilus sp.]|nr:methyl-accepting chemotaxis protein [Terracidiphilus sp.]
MDTLRNLTIRRKLVLAFGITCLFSVSIAILAAIMLTSVSNTTFEVNSKWLPGIRTMDAMHSQHSTIRRYVMGYAMCDSQICRDTYRTKGTEARQKLVDGFNEFISRYATTQAEKDELNYLSGLVARDNELLDQTMHLIDAGQKEAGIRLLSNESRDAYETAYATGDKVVAEYNQGATEATQHALSVAATSKAIILVCAVIVLLISIAATALLTKLIARPLIEAATLMHRVAGKDLTQKLEIDSQDEVGQLAASINTTIDSFHSVMQSLAESTDFLSQTAGEITTIAEHAASSAHTQNSKINQIAAAAQEMTSTIGEISHNVESAAHSSVQSAEKAESGGHVMKSASDTMQNIAESSDGIAARMTSLEQHSQDIGNVITVIQEISEQTNLLALNAAIEAARAGEHGRGFAVVAGEVRRLAERTKSATEEISSTIHTIQEETHSTLDVVQNNRTSVENGQSETSRAFDNLNEIISASKEVESQIQLIASATTEQTAASHEIAQSAGEISSLAAESATGAENAAEKLREVSHLAQKLKANVQEFRLR